MTHSIGFTIASMILGAGNKFVHLIYGPFVQSFHQLAVGIVTLFVMLMAYLIMSGRAGRAWPHLAAAAVIIPLTFTMVFESSIYMDWIYGTFMDTSQHLSSFMASSGKNTSGLAGIFQSVDAIFGKIFSIIDVVYSKGGAWWHVGTNMEIGIVIFGLTIVFGSLYAIFTVLIIQGWLMLQLLIAVGGIPIILSGTPFTRHIFTSWLRACFQYALTPVFTAAVMGLTITALDSAVAHLQTIDIIKNGVFNADVGAVFLIGVVSIWLHLKAPELASALTGGTMTQMGGAIGGAASLAGGVMGAARSSGLRQGGLAAGGRAAGRAFSEMKGIFRK